jgi:pilus assembly protein Flp/PilA
MHLAVGDDTGASAVEYGLIVFAIAAVISLVVFGFGRVVEGTFTDSCDTISSTLSTSASC